MNRYLSFLPVALSGLLAACASEPTATTPPATPTPTETEASTPIVQGPGLRGELIGVAAGADVDLALLGVDMRGRPRALLGQIHLRGNGEALPFHLPVSDRQVPQDLRLELRGRVSQSGRLVQRLPARTIVELSDQDLGALHLVPAP
ncbi:MAG TPA: hypothetical protein DEO91_20985 [Pseudomonas sp.]|uniref:hypothetical protein n=1 Tax=Pseudomonas sp. Marseille-Q0931 TaxID=2697507 RepID=UPI000EC25669|nr:hypothetical protein [Pseudomonas sp. Marseille-Q0931]HBZ96071.1 hypothetical protein [Pseudomonas sp.]